MAKKLPVLLPCPFCGNKPRYHESDSTLAFVWCEKCGIEFRRYQKTAQYAGRTVTKLWNTRKENK